ncbi:MAG: FixH family protein [Chitinophagaceae bacterium]|nr:FixH family protein [Chitinophagaceae bacterium]
MKHILYGLIGLSLIFASCGKTKFEPENPTQNLHKLGQGLLSTGDTVALFSEEALINGYQKIFIQLPATYGSSSNIKISSLMDMGTMKHSSPSVPPIYNNQSGLFEAAVVFTMSSNAGSWQLFVTVGSETLTIPVTVAESPTKIVGTYTSTDNERYVIALYPTKGFKVGLNDIYLLISKRESMMNFPTVDGLKVEMTPEMVSMGHGSPNNIDPVSIGGGVYKGKANFTMTGDWRLNLKISSEGNILIDNAYLDILF